MSKKMLLIMAISPFLLGGVSSLGHAGDLQEEKQPIVTCDTGQWQPDLVDPKYQVWNPEWKQDITGNYTQSCKNCKATRTNYYNCKFTCECKNNKGEYNPTELPDGFGWPGLSPVNNCNGSLHKGDC
jgi:hypothetical protein